MEIETNKTYLVIDDKERVFTAKFESNESSGEDFYIDDDYQGVTFDTRVSNITHYAETPTLDNTEIKWIKAET